MTKVQESGPLGKRLKRERQRLELSQAVLAAAGGVSKATQVSYEAGTTMPDAIYLSRIAETGADLGWILRGQRETATPNWELLFEIQALIEEWAGDRATTTPLNVKQDLQRTLYSQFCRDGIIEPTLLATVMRLAG